MQGSQQLSGRSPLDGKSSEKPYLKIKLPTVKPEPKMVPQAKPRPKIKLPPPPQRLGVKSEGKPEVKSETKLRIRGFGAYLPSAPDPQVSCTIDHMRNTSFPALADCTTCRPYKTCFLMLPRMSLKFARAAAEASAVASAGLRLAAVACPEPS